MSKEAKSTNSQKLRFPQFKKDAKWKERRLSEVLKEHDLKSSGSEEVFSVSVHKGVVNQIEHLGRSFSAATTDHYKLVLPGDIIYTKSPTGEFPYGIIKQSKVAKPVIVSPLYGVFTPETKALGYILDSYFESQSNTYNYLSSIVQKGAKNTINILNNTFLSKSLLLPINKEEQQKIADCLSSLDELIYVESQKYDTLKAYKKGLMQHLLANDEQTVPMLRFAEFLDSGDWAQGTLCEKGVAFFANEKVRLEELDLEHYVSTENLLPDYTGKVVSSKLPSSGSVTRFEINDILLSNIRPYLKKVWLADINGGASNDVIVIRADSKIDAKFLSFLLKNDDFINYIMKGAEGVKMPRGDKDQIKLYRIRFPEKEEQQKIADCLSSLDEVITAQIKIIETLKVHKKGMIHGLFPDINEEAL